MLNLQLPEGGEQFDAAVFTQAGQFVDVGSREFCELKAQEIGGLYCWIVNGRAYVRTSFDLPETTYEIEGRDELGNWSSETVGDTQVLFATRAEAEAALADLVSTLGWQADQMRIVERYA